jgi:hypothetical protein
MTLDILYMHFARTVMLNFVLLTKTSNMFIDALNAMKSQSFRYYDAWKKNEDTKTTRKMSLF